MKSISSKKCAGLILLLVLILQIASLFRVLPTTPACGQIRDLGHAAHVLINCDSAVFMKDSQNPNRLINGESVYQDRPLYGVLSWAIAKSLIAVGIPDKTIPVIGNSGKTTLYSEVHYLSYLAINLLVLLSAVWLSVSWFRKKVSIEKTDSITLLGIANVVLIVTANELTKTFFWTPHSQMFNILLPAYALYLGGNLERLKRPMFFYTNLVLIGILLYFYSLCILLLYFLVISSFKNIYKRLGLLIAAILPYLLWPKIVDVLGGTYHNQNLTRYREFIWLLDSAKNGTFIENFFKNWSAFGATFPIIPSLLVCAVLFYIWKKENFRISVKRNFLLGLFPIGYLFTLSIMGYNARRLTMGPFIYLELVIFVLFILVFKKRSERFQKIALIVLVLVQLLSWVFSHGPMA